MTSSFVLSIVRLQRNLSFVNLSNLIPNTKNNPFIFSFVTLLLSSAKCQACYLKSVLYWFLKSVFCYYQTLFKVCVLHLPCFVNYFITFILLPLRLKKGFLFRFISGFVCTCPCARVAYTSFYLCFYCTIQIMVLF